MQQVSAEIDKSLSSHYFSTVSKTFNDHRLENQHVSDYHHFQSSRLPDAVCEVVIIQKYKVHCMSLHVCPGETFSLDGHLANFMEKKLSF